jgi:hypothetical protein
VSEEQRVRHCFVDEAGDPVLFDRRGRILLGTLGCSRFFMIGVAHIVDPAACCEALERLRSELVNDAYFRGVPSIDKTRASFHAKDDLPEIRREVFRLLPSLGVKVQVIVRRKTAILRQVQNLNAASERYHYRPNEVYDDCIKRLFRNLLHKASENHIVFARRGKRERADALRAALNAARVNFEKKWGKPSDKPVTIASRSPHQEAGLQVIDYYLWALQRMYERQEDRFFALLAPAYGLIIDLDVRRQKPHGRYYSDADPLTLEKMKKPPGG